MLCSLVDHVAAIVSGFMSQGASGVAIYGLTRLSTRCRTAGSGTPFTILLSVGVCACKAAFEQLTRATDEIE